MPWWCDLYGNALFVLGLVLLVAAAVAAVLQLVVATRAMRAAVREAASPAAPGALHNVDPVQALGALQGLLEAIKGLPAWIPVMLAGLALVWLAGQRPEACAPGAAAAAASAPAAASR